MGRHAAPRGNASKAIDQRSLPPSPPRTHIRLESYVHEMTRNHERLANRSASRDYTEPGAYFVTSCTANRELLLLGPSYVRVVTDALVAAWKCLPKCEPGCLRRHAEPRSRDHRLNRRRGGCRSFLEGRNRTTGDTLPYPTPARDYHSPTQMRYPSPGCGVGPQPASPRTHRSRETDSKGGPQ